MANPMTVGTTAVVAIIRNRKRVGVRFQNVGTTTLYLARNPIIPSATNYEILLSAPTTGEMNEAYVSTDSTSQFNVVSSASGGSMAIFETVKIR